MISPVDREGDAVEPGDWVRVIHQDDLKEVLAVNPYGVFVLWDKRYGYHPRCKFLRSDERAFTVYHRSTTT